MSGSIGCWHCIEVKYVINATSSSTNSTSYTVNAKKKKRDKELDNKIGPLI